MTSTITTNRARAAMWMRHAHQNLHTSRRSMPYAPSMAKLAIMHIGENLGYAHREVSDSGDSRTIRQVQWMRDSIVRSL